MRRPSSLTTGAGVLATLAAVAVTAFATPPASAAPAVTGRTAAPAAGTASPVAWGPCAAGSTLARYGAECGFVTVPLDYSDPGGKKAHLAVSRVKAKTAVSKGPILVNPGGPGGSGLIYSIFQSFVPDGAGLAYDWIGFDPRGVGQSTPKLSCDTHFFDGPRPAYEPSAGTEQANLARVQQYAKDCAAKNDPVLLNNIKTTVVAKDVDEIRKALGAPRISWYGFSYGTYLGQVYTQLFPGHTDKVVLDGVVDPRRVFEKSNLDQDVAFERNIGLYFDWVAKYDNVYHLGRTRDEVRARYENTKAQLALHPAGGVVGSAEFTDIVLYAGYYDSTWLEIGDALSRYINQHDEQVLVDEYDNFVGPGDDNGYAVYLAVQCTDAPWSATYAKFRKTQVRTDRVAPFETWGNAWYNAACVYWPAPASKPTRITGSGASSVLLISQTDDAATPYPGALEVRKLFKGASLIAEPGGTTHAGSLSGNPCTDGAIARYLATGELPARRPGNQADLLCNPLPHPVPTAAAAASAAGDAARAAAPQAPALAGSGAGAVRLLTGRGGRSS